MNKTLFLCSLILFLLIPFANAALSPCSSGSLTTAVNKKFQMAYADEDFLQIYNIDSLKDVSQLKDLTCLQYMDATDRNTTGDIANLNDLTNLEVFSLYSNPNVSGDICSLAEATKLRSLKFAFDPEIIGDISCLKNLIKLETFVMTHTQISGDLSVFANMPNLKAIYVSGTNIKGDICALSNLTNLEELGIADEYPGNPDIAGDLLCLNNLKKLTRVSLYNTNTTNCEQFTQSHQNIEQGGCSKESLKTLIDYGQRYEQKIGKETQTEVRGQPNYQQNADIGSRSSDIGNQQDAGIESKPADGRAEIQYKEPDNRNFLTKLIDWIKSLFGRIVDRSNGAASDRSNESASERGNEAAKQSRQTEYINQIRSGAGPGGCKSQAECDAFCSKPENEGACSQFAPPEGANDREESENRPDLGQGRPGGCKSQAECDAFCSKPENREACPQSATSDRESDRGSVAEEQGVSASKPVCRVSVLPASKGTAPYEAKVCVDNPNERIQQEYKDYVDFDGDGSWDDYQDLKHGCHSYNYLKQGIFSPKAKIVDSKGIESEICQTTVTVK